MAAETSGFVGFSMSFLALNRTPDSCQYDAINFESSIGH
jgi:hypothetical protein